MTALSKYYSEILVDNKVSCKYVLHPTTTCNQFLLTHIPLIFLRTGQFFFPLYFIPLLANPRNITKAKFIEVCKVFWNSVQTGSLTVITVFFMICTFSKYNGYVSFWTLLPLPSLIGSWSFYFSSDKVLSLFSHATSIVHLEMLILDGSIWPWNLVQNSRFVRTLMFMCLSGIILDSIYMDNGSAFWLFHPAKNRNGIENGYSHYNIHKESTHLLNIMEKSSACHHKSSCFVHNKKIMRNYLLLGIALEMAKSLLNNFGLICRQPGMGLFHAVKNINYNFLLFISGYPTLTNVMNCSLNRWFNESSRFNQMMSAIIGGIPFYFASNAPSIFSHTIATAAEAVHYRYKKNYKNSNSKVHRYMTRIPFAILIQVFGGTFMYTVRLFFPWLAPKFLHRLINLLTNCKIDEIGERVHSIWIPKTIV